jgi:acyl-CoA thioesterase-1
MVLPFSRAWLGLALLLLLVGGCVGQAGTDLPARPPVLVAIGASDAVGVGASDPAQRSWPVLLQQFLPAGTRLVNLGIAGARVADALEQGLPVALDANPDYVVLWIAVNDLVAGTPLPDYERDLNALLSQLATSTRARLFLANVPNLTALPRVLGRDPATLEETIAAWNAVIARAAATHGAVLVDLAADGGELAQNPTYLSADGFHPSDAGYRRIAERFWQAMATAGVPGRS